jgi:chain length determinant protein EpsF
VNPQDILLIVWAHRYVIVAMVGITVLSAVGVSLLLPSQYDATASVVVTFRDPQTQMLPVQLSPSYMATQLDIVQSRNVALQVVDKLKLTESPSARELWQDSTDGRGSIRDWLADRLLKKLTLTPSRDSRVLDLTYSGSDPRIAAAVANAFANAYIDTTVQLAVEPARRDAAWLNDQLKPLRQRLEAAQAKLSAFQREKGIFSNDERLDVETARLNELSSQLVQAQGLMHEAQSRQTELEHLTAKGGSAESLKEFSSDSYIQNIKSELAQREAQLAQLRGQFGVNHPQRQRAYAEVVNLRAQLASATRRLARSVASEADIARARVEALNKEVAAQRAKVLQLKEARDQMPPLEREVVSAQAAYDTAAARFNESQLRSREPDANVAMLSPAVEPTKRSSPRMLLNLLVATFLGGGLGVGAALLLELLAPRARTAQMLQSRLGLPMLGVLEA